MIFYQYLYSGRYSKPAKYGNGFCQFPPNLKLPQLDKQYAGKLEVLFFNLNPILLFWDVLMIFDQ